MIFALITTSALSVLLFLSAVLLFMLFRKKGKERQQIEDETNRNMEHTINYLKGILDNIDAIIYANVPETGELLFVNKRTRQMFNMDDGPLNGKYCFEIFRGTDERCGFCPCKKLDKSPDGAVVWDEYFEDADMHITHSDSYIDWPNGQRVHLQYATDITEIRKANEKLSRQLELKSLLTKLSSIFLSVNDMDAELSNALREIGETMGLARVLLFKTYKSVTNIRCCYEWQNPANSTGSRIGETTQLSDNFGTIVRQYRARGKVYLTADDMTDEVREAILPYRKTHANFLTGFIWIDDNVYAILDFSRDIDETWSREDTYAALMVMDIITNAFKHHVAQKQLMRAKEAAEQASFYKTDFIAKMSHEIRTPMNAIIGMTELALRESLPEDKDMHIATVKQAGSNLLAIISDILDYSKIEAGKMEILPSGYSVSSLISDLVSIIRMRAVDSHIRFVVNVDSTIPRFLFGDETRIRQAVINTLSNAVKYTENGSVWLNVYIKPPSVSDEDILADADMVIPSAESGAETSDADDDKNISIVFEVKDTGYGIQKSDLKRLFSEFTQIETDKSRSSEGVGLGLVIMRSIVMAMGGKIYVKSEYGKGSTFTIVVRQKYLSEVPVAQVKAPGKKHVLVYGSDKIYTDSIAKSLANLKVPYTLASGSEDFGKKMDSGKFKFLFISHNLFEQSKSTIYKHAEKTDVVLLTDFGENVPNYNLKILAMPVYCTQIADILNGVSGKQAAASSDLPVLSFKSAGGRALVVDDIRTNLKVAEGLLAPYKLRIDLCTGGAEAIEAVKTALNEGSPYDIIFMDHKMPKMDGMETTKHIRELGEKEPYFNDVPIVALTANAVSGVEETYLKNGFSDFLFKPIDTTQLNTIMEKWIL